MTRTLVVPGEVARKLPGYWAFLNLPDARGAILELSPYSERTRRDDLDAADLLETWS